MVKVKRKAMALFCVLTMIVQMFLPFCNALALAAEENDTGPGEGVSDVYTRPESPAVTYNMNVDWKYKRALDGKEFPLAAAREGVAKDGKQFYEVGYDDSDWENVSLPHAVNADDSFDGVGVDAGEVSLYRGFMFYRKNVLVPQTDAGKKFILEFEAFRQSVYVYVNGTMAGYYEAGVAAVGFDITDYIKAGEQNLIAVATDNASTRGSSFNTQETIPGHEPGDLSGVGYQWNTKDFNEVQGGLTGNVNLYAKNKIYQTLPLYNNLKTKGNYIYGSNFDFRAGSADITVEAEIRNESGSDADITLEVNVVDGDGKLAASFSKTQKVAAATDAGAKFQTVVPDTAYDNSGNGVETGKVDASTVDVSYITATQNVEGLHFWSDVSPYLYTVYTVLKQGDQIIDLSETTTGFREVTYDKDKGLQINGVSTYLTGYAQRSTNEWAAIGVANDWLSDVDMQMVKESNANMIRWMHIAPNPVDIRAGDKYGVVSVCPAGDKEGDQTGRAWDQRLETMRDVIIYFRNSPSILFWEAGNNEISAPHMKQMTDIRKELDPNGDRFMGCRTINSVEQIKEAEWVGTMIYRHDAAAYASMEATGNYIPMIETEYHRNESPRRIWDDYTPPDYDYVNKWLGDGGSKTDGYDIWDQTQEDFALTMAADYSYFYDNRVGGTGKNYYSGAALMVWSDSNMHVRNCGVENCRTSGRVDPIRVKKESFYAIQTIQSQTPAVKILGHWNYPEYIKGDKENGNYWYEDKTFNGTFWEGNGTMLQRDSTNKTVYVIGSPSVSRVELYVNDELFATDKTADSNCIYAFPGVDITKAAITSKQGSIVAKAYNDRDEVVAEDKIVTVKPMTIKLTPVLGPNGFLADGSDLMYVDVAIVDENGNVCPIDERKISFTVSDKSKAVFLGGYNSGIGERIVNHKDYVFAECGINKVFLRSTREAGSFTLTASAEGMQPVSITLETKAFELEGGLTTTKQQSFAQGEVPDVVPPETAPAMKALGGAFTAVFDGENKNVYTVSEDAKDYYEVKVNGTKVAFTDRPYKPDNSTGVVAEVSPILDALKAAGVDLSYTFATEGTIPDYFISEGGQLPLLTVNAGATKIELANVSTVVFTNGDRNLTNFGVTTNSAKTTLLAELSAVIGKIPGVSVETDTQNKLFEVSCGGAAAQSGFDADGAYKTEEASSGDEVLSYIDGNTQTEVSCTYKVDGKNETETVKLSPGEGMLSPDGTPYLTNHTEWIGDFEGLADNATQDLLWEADILFGQDKYGARPRNKSRNEGTQMVRHDVTKDGVTTSKLALQTGSDKFNDLCEIDPAKWYHVELIGHYNANTEITLFLYEYDENQEKKLVHKQANAGSRNNLSGGANHWCVDPGISVDNLKITSIAPDKLTVTSQDDKTELKAGNALQFACSASRNDAPLTTPMLTWSVCDENGAVISDEEISISNGGLLSVGLNAASQTVYVKAETASGVYDQMQITITAVDLSSVKFDSLTLTADRNYVSSEEPLTLTASAKKAGADVSLTADDLIWYVCDADNMRKIGDDLKWISVKNGVVSVTERAISQDLTIRAADPTDAVRGAFKIHVKSSNALENGEDGTLDSLLFAENCETPRTGTEFVKAADGTSAYKVTAGAYKSGEIKETAGDIVVDMDIQFTAEGAGFQPAKTGKLNTCVIYHDGRLAIQTGGSSYTYYSEKGEITTDDWYHITLIRKQKSYAHIIFDSYDENGEIDLSKRKILQDVSQRNDEPTAFVNFNVGTAYDNLRVLTPAPTGISVSTDAAQVFAGNTVQVSSQLLWNGLEMKNPDASTFEYKLYDADNQYPLEDSKITINGEGVITIDATVDAQDVYVRAIAKKSGIYESAKFSIISSDIFAVKGMGISEDMSRIVDITVDKNFFYADEVTFVTGIFDESGALKAVKTRQLYGDSLKTGENTVVIGMDIPADFDRNKDKICVFLMTKLESDEITEESTPGASVAISGGNAVITVPDYDEQTDVEVLVLKRNANEKKLKDSDIVYFNQVKAENVKDAIPVGNLDSCIAKTGGKLNGALTLYTALLGERTELPEDPDDTNPDNPGGTTPDNPGGTNPDNPGGTTPDNPGGTNPDNPGGTTPDNPGGTTPDNPDVKPPVVSEPVGSKIPSGKDSFKVKTAGDNPSVEFSGTTNKASIIKVPDTVPYKGVEYKVTSIAKDAFKNNSTIKTVEIGKNVTAIGDNAFFNCKNLKTVKINGPVKSIGAKAFAKCKKITTFKTGDQVLTIGKSAFEDCSGLRTLTLGKNVKTIGDNAFKGCSALTKVTIPNKVTSIGAKAFYGDKKLTTLTIGTGLTSIGKSAFEKCSKLKKITISSAKIKTVGKKAFKGTDKKAQVKAPKKKVAEYKKKFQTAGLSKKATVKKK